MHIWFTVCIIIVFWITHTAEDLETAIELSSLSCITENGQKCDMHLWSFTLFCLLKYQPTLMSEKETWWGEVGTNAPFGQSSTSQDAEMGEAEPVWEEVRHLDCRLWGMWHRTSQKGLDSRNQCQWKGREFDLAGNKEPSLGLERNGDERGTVTLED